MNTKETNIIFEGIPDQTSFTRLFELYHSRFCLFAFGILNNKQTAEDIVQDCFIKLWQRRDKINWKIDVVPYVYTMVRNACYNYLRDNNTTSSLHDEVAEQDNFLHQVIEAETLYEIHQAIERLPPKCGNIFKALFLEGKQVKQVSRELNITESTIRSHKAAALLLLKQTITKILLFLFFFSC